MERGLVPFFCSSVLIDFYLDVKIHGWWEGKVHAMNASYKATFLFWFFFLNRGFR